LRKVLRLARHMQLTIPGRLESSLSEHRQIMQAFKEKNPDLADQNMQNHLKQQWFSLVDKSESNTRVKNK